MPKNLFSDKSPWDEKPPKGWPNPQKEILDKLNVKEVIKAVKEKQKEKAAAESGSQTQTPKPDIITRLLA